MGRTFHITTLGCPKNDADSRAMERSLRSNGFVKAKSSEQADFHLINSCAFIEDARKETIETVLEAAAGKEKSPEQKLILAGCFSERYSAEITAELPEVDFAFGTGLYGKAGDLIAEKFHVPVEKSVPDFAAMPAAAGHTAPVKISDGCDRSCAFCAIPSFRGSFRTTDRGEVMTEIRSLVMSGVREVCLVSQDTNSYGRGPGDLLALLDEIHEIDDLTWIRLLYLYPDKKTEKIVQGLGTRMGGKIVPYLESPVQHVSSRILKGMKRAGDGVFFRDLFGQARELIPDVEIRTTFLLGFPGEEDSDVEDLLNFITDVRPEKLALFAYSEEAGTGAEGLAHPKSVLVKERMNRVRAHHLAVLKEVHRSRMGRTYDCMVDAVERTQIVCRRPQDAPDIDEVVYVPRQMVAGNPAPGSLLRLRVDGYHEYDMTAVPAG